MRSFFQDQKTKLIAILALALVLRLIGVASRPIWYDEAFSALFAERGPAAVLSGTVATTGDSSASEEHPPAYYFLLWGWMQFFGSGLVSARTLSVVLSLGISICIFAIAGHLFDRSTALVATLISAILPFQIHYGQEIRMYVLLTVWLCIATYAFLKRRWVLFSLAAALAQYTHNLAAIYLIPLALTPVFQMDWKTLRSLVLSATAALLMYSPWLTQLPAQLSKVTTIFWIERPGPEKLFTLMLLYLPNLPLAGGELVVGLFVATFAIGLAAFQTYRTFREDRPSARPGLWLAYMSFTPPLLLWTVSQFSPLYVERALLPAHAMFCIWIAWAFTRAGIPRPIQFVAVALILFSAGLGLHEHVTYKGFPYGPYPALDQQIRDKLMAGDVIVHSSKLTYLPAFYFDRDLAQGFLLDPPGASTDTLSAATQKILNLSAKNDIAQATLGAKRVWYIVFQQSLDELRSRGIQTAPDLQFLDRNFILASTAELDDLRLYLYSRRLP